MTLKSGTRLGRYEIRSKIGEGGMGEVYRAYDPKINRDVAIKVLPPAFSADKELLARFEQEAQAAGAHATRNSEGNRPPRLVPGLGDGDHVVRWSSDDRSLFVSQGILPTEIYRLDVSTGRKEFLKKIMPTDPAGILGPLGILLTPDGKGYVYQIGRNLSDLYLVEGLK